MKKSIWIPTLVVALLFGTISFVVQHVPWVSSVLANIAVVLLLLIPGEWLASQLQAGIKEVKHETDRAVESAEAAGRLAKETAQTLDDVREQLQRKQSDELNEEIGVYEGMTANAGREALIFALKRATRDHLITTEGVRSPVWETDLHYRFLIGAPEEELVVRLESDGGESLSIHPWRAGVGPVEFYQELVQAVRDAGRDLGTLLNDPTQSIENVSQMLAKVVQYRAQELAGHRTTLRDIIEYKDGWFITERYLIPEERLHYAIDIQERAPIDWYQHLEQRYMGAAAALDLAGKIHGVDFSGPQAASAE